jgi:predicted dehydrogenase
MAHSGALGDIRSFHSVFTVQVRAGNTRTHRAEGGGPLLDLGIYCIHAARRLFQSEPEQVLGLTLTRKGDPRFAEVPEMFTAILQFPGERLATFTCSFGSSRVMTYDIVGTDGAVHLDPAYDYASDIRFIPTIGGDRQEEIYPQQDQFAAQIDHFADCIRQNTEPLTSGDDGLLDMKIADALEQSAASNQAVNLRDFT